MRGKLGITTVLAAFLLGTTLWTPRPACAQDDDAEGSGPDTMLTGEVNDTAAREHFEVGQTLFQVGRYADAAGEFEQAYALSPQPLLLFNAYLAYRDAGDVQNAARTLRAYLEVEPETPERARLSIRLRAMEEALARDAEETETRSVEASAGSRGRDGEREVSAGWIVTAGGAGLLLGSGIAALITNARLNDIESACPGDICPPDYDLNGARDDARRASRTTDVLLWTGVAAAATGVVLLVLESRGEESDDLAALPGAACDARGCMLSLEGSF